MAKLQLTRRVGRLRPSPTLTLDAKVKQLQSLGQPVINLTIGEPDFATPKYIQRAAITAIRAGFTHYTPSAGIPELRLAITKKLTIENGISYQPSEILVGVGTKHVLALALLALCQSGDEVIITTPTWSTYVEQVKLAGARPVLVPLASPFIPTAEAIAPQITSRTKVLILNSPGNPAGAVIPRRQLQRIAGLAVAKGVFVISDEIYEKITYSRPAVSIASLSEAIKGQTLTVNGFSKAYAMTGWRVGYGAGPKKLIEAMSALAGQTTSGTSSISQKAAVEALTGPQEAVSAMVQQFSQRKEYVCRALSLVKGISFADPEGAFYLFVDIRPLLGRPYRTASSWCEALLEQAGVAVVPGEAFCAPGYFRLSFATPLPFLQDGVARIKQFIEGQVI